MTRFFGSEHKFVVTQDGILPDLMRYAAVDQRRLMPESMDGASFNYVKECTKSPVTEKILKVHGVTGVVVSPQFLSVYKDQDFSWVDINHHIEDILEEAFAKEQIIVEGELDAEVKSAIVKEEIVESDSEDEEKDPDLIEIETDISELLDMRAKPIVKADGGDLEFRGFDEESGTVWIYFKGACESCTSSGITLHQAIGQMLKHYVPEVSGIKRCGADGEPLDDDGNATDDWSGNPPALKKKAKTEKKAAAKLSMVGKPFVNKKSTATV